MSKKNGEKKIDLVKGPDWKSLDVAVACSHDLNAAIAFLCLLRDNPEMMVLVVTAVEDWKKQMIAAEVKKAKVDASSI